MAVTKEIKDTIVVTIDEVFKKMNSISWLERQKAMKDEAFKNILNLHNNEVYVDIGAYRGDTVDTFLSYTDGSYNHIICAEPDTKTFKSLPTIVQTLIILRRTTWRLLTLTVKSALRMLTADSLRWEVALCRKALH